MNSADGIRPHTAKSIPSAPCAETWMVRAILALFMVVAFRAIHHNATNGQDIASHMANTKRLMAEPGKWFTNDTTFRPLLYWIGGWCVRFTKNAYGYQLASIMFTLAGTAALALLHDATRRVVTSPLLRVAGIALVAFLPLTVITTVIFAADTVASLPFVLSGWAIMRCLEEDTESQAGKYAALAGFSLIVGNLSKATFMVLPAAVLLALLALWRARRLTIRRAGMLVLLAVALPVTAGGLIMAKAARETAGAQLVHSFNWKGTGELTFRSLLGVKPSDRRVLDAPEYLASAMNDAGIYYPLLVANNYSYPALLHLGIFTDVLNFANDAVVPRPEPERTAARWSVRLGLVFSVSALAAVLVFWIRTAFAFVRPDRMPSTAALVWSCLAMAWFFPIAGALPFVDNPYIKGYWLPRLVMPAIWIFYLGLFAAADRLPGRWPARVAVLLATLVAVLSVQEIRSVWY